MIRKATLQDLPLADAELAFEQARGLPGGVVEMTEAQPGCFTVTAVWDDAGTALDKAQLDAFERLPAPPSRPTTRGGSSAATSLGALSERFESNGKPGAIGFDSTGGYSYGAYQIATRTGTLERFLAFLERAFPALAAELEAAGGVIAAVAGSESFKTAWRSLAQREPAFAAAQHGFIRATHHEPFLAALRSRLALDVAGRSLALQNVAWSVAVQHGPNNTVFANALAGRDSPTMSDGDIIRAVYAERSRLMRYFPRSSERVREALAGRFAEEMTLALAMLGRTDGARA